MVRGQCEKLPAYILEMLFALQMDQEAQEERVHQPFFESHIIYIKAKKVS